MKIYLAVFLSLICLFTHASQTIFYPAIVVNKVDENMVVFNECKTLESCRTIGNESGYDMANFDFKPGLKKLRSIATGTLGLGLAIVAALSCGAIGIALTGGAFASGSVAGFFVGAVIGGPGAGITIATVGKKTNPIYQWKLSNLQKDLEAKILNDEEMKQFVIEFDDYKSLKKYKERYLLPLLKRIKSLE